MLIRGFVMKVPTIQVVVDEPLKQRLEELARAEDRSVSSYVRVLINRHLLALERAAREQANLHSIYG